ncbi:MAG: universal stress protein [Ilumatobacter sp.]|jgi:nucleotide-binding universal stress UspA family protein|uniref:universal stress protein n=1 Tax=Ilumatobacter sp. TaxID=1967498 RepID=UPI003919B46B
MAQTSTTRTALRHSPVEGAWVVGVDGSERSINAVRWALAHAPGRAELIRLAAAWNIPAAPMSPPFDPVLSDVAGTPIERDLQAELERISTELAATSISTTDDSDEAGPRIETVVARGGAAAVLLDAASSASLLVVGSRGRGGFTRLLIGSTSTQVATHALNPTAVIPDGCSLDPVTKLIVAIDGSPNSIAALRWALRFAAPGSTVECVMVWDVSPISVGADQFFFPQASELAEERFQHLVDDVIDEVGVQDVQVKRRFVEGRPRNVLADLVGPSELLVMGARGHGAIGAAVLGSVSTWLLHRVHAPMVVIPDPRTDDD